MYRELNCPSSAVSTMRDVLAGEYGMPIEAAPHIILDIGANIGAFTEWARVRWPGATVYAYEPNAENAIYFKKNFPERGDNLVFIEAAVSNKTGKAILFTGNGNACVHSLVKSGATEDEGNLVLVVDAASLPPADFVKIDTEGSELTILERLLGVQHPTSIIFEWHSKEDRERCSALLIAHDYRLVYEAPHTQAYGVLGFTRDSGA